MSPRKRVPSYWWDFRHHEHSQIDIIVESDDDRFPLVGVFHKVEDAESLIADLKAGRVDPRKLAAALRTRTHQKAFRA